MRHFIFVFLVFLAQPAATQSYQDSYELRFGTLQVARLVLAVNATADGYALAGRAESTGLVGLFRTLHFDMNATGTHSGNQFAAQSYREDVDTGRRASTVDMQWQDGRPVVITRAPLEPQAAWHIDPATQTGTIDPLSAVYSIARPRPEAELCGFELDVFDGRRRSQVMLGSPTVQNGRIICRGAYSRRAGFSPEEMAEQTEFPFTAVFAPTTQGLWVLESLDLASLYGAMRITRAGR